ncbi:MAG: hypothetical protein PQJ46_07020, partial [Spirochaetales bacterium]|nr:hypothetical protein [Spirochaetales bacterium]
TLEKIREKLGLVGLDSMNTIVKYMADRDASKVIDLCSEIISGGVSIEQFSTDLAEYFRSLLFISCGIDKENLLGYAKSRYLETNLKAFTKLQLEKALDLIFNFYRDVRYSINPRFELELLLSQLSDLRAWISPSEIYDRLEALKGDIASGVTIAVEKPSQEPVIAPPEPSPVVNNVVSSPVAEEPDNSVSDDNASFTNVTSLSDRDKQSILESIRKQKLTLAASVEQAVQWNMNGGKLKFDFENGYTASVVKKDKKLIQEIIKNITGQDIMVEVEVVQSQASENEADQAINRQVDVVKKVFRGEIVNGVN